MMVALDEKGGVYIFYSLIILGILAIPFALVGVQNYFAPERVT